MKTFKITVNEEELKALINHNRYSTGYDVKIFERAHKLTKLLNRDTSEIESDPRPEVTAAKEEQPSGW